MILVTGGAGYVGSHFLHAYLTANPGAPVVVVDNLSEGHRQALVHDQIHLVKENIGNKEAMTEIFQRYPVKAVVHFAASAYVGESQLNPFKYFRNNVIESLNLFEVMEKSGVRKIVFSSTCATYGIPQYIPLNENHPQQPVNVYGTTKYMLEQALRALHASCGWSYASMRYFNASGADENGQIGESHNPETHLIPLVLKTATGELPYLLINGDDYDTPDGTCIRDYVHVTDLARAHIQALHMLDNQHACESVNIGSTRGASVKEIVSVCEQITGKSIPCRIGPRREGDAPALLADGKRAEDIFGWTPFHDLQSIVRSAWRWEQQRRY